MPYIEPARRVALAAAGFNPEAIASGCHSTTELALALFGPCTSFAEMAYGTIPKATFGMRSPGDLNYVITTVCHAYIRQAGISYTNMQNVVGALERLLDDFKAANHRHIGAEQVDSVVGAIRCAELELYARKIRPYEDLKITDNGDV